MKASAPEELYERDFYAWTQLQARALGHHSRRHWYEEQKPGALRRGLSDA